MGSQNEKKDKEIRNENKKRRQEYMKKKRIFFLLDFKINHPLLGYLKSNLYLVLQYTIVAFILETSGKYWSGLYLTLQAIFGRFYT